MKLRDQREAYMRRLQERYWYTSFKNFKTRLGDIYEIDFGANIGQEFSGRHLGICLTNSSIYDDCIYVIPLSTKIKKYRLTDIISVKSNKQLIYAGLVPEVMRISKRRVFKHSKIIKNNKHICLGRAPLHELDLSKYVILGGNR